MTDSAPAPYAGLTPDLVLDALASCGWNGDGRLLALKCWAIAFCTPMSSTGKMSGRSS